MSEGDDQTEELRSRSAWGHRLRNDPRTLDRPPEVLEKQGLVTGLGWFLRLDRPSRPGWISACTSHRDGKRRPSTGGLTVSEPGCWSGRSPSGRNWSRALPTRSITRAASGARCDWI